MTSSEEGRSLQFWTKLAQHWWKHRKQEIHNIQLYKDEVLHQEYCNLYNLKFCSSSRDSYSCFSKLCKVHDMYSSQFHLYSWLPGQHDFFSPWLIIHQNQLENMFPQEHLAHPLSDIFHHINVPYRLISNPLGQGLHYRTYHKLKKMYFSKFSILGNPSKML